MKHISEKTLSKYFDSELDEAETTAVAEHLDECLQCREIYEQFATLSAKLEVLPEMKPDPYFASRVKRAAAEERRTPLRSRLLIPVTATATTLVSLVIGGYLGQSVYTDWVEDTPDYENGYTEYLDVTPMQDYPEGSFGDAYIDLISEEVNDEG